jgi:hypothetical protein
MPFAIASGIERSERASAARTPSAKNKIMGEIKFAAASAMASCM